jgi:hypothetical protein
MSKAKSTLQIFRWPLLIAVVSTVGLIGALLKDGDWDLLACALLAIPVLAGIAPLWQRHAPPPQRE